MRHVLAADPAPSRARRVRKATRATVLIAPACRPDRLPAPGLRARRSAIHVAPVAATAQHHLGATPPAQKHPSRLVHPRPRPQPKCDGHQERWMQYSTAHRGASRLPGVGRGDGTYFPVGPSSRLFYFGAAIIGRASTQWWRTGARLRSPATHTSVPRNSGALQPAPKRQTESVDAIRQRSGYGNPRSTLRGKYPRVLAAINTRSPSWLRSARNSQRH